MDKRFRWDTDASKEKKYELLLRDLHNFFGPQPLYMVEEEGKSVEGPYNQDQTIACCCVLLDYQCRFRVWPHGNPQKVKLYDPEDTDGGAGVLACVGPAGPAPTLYEREPIPREK